MIIIFRFQQAIMAIRVQRPKEKQVEKKSKVSDGLLFFHDHQQHQLVSYHNNFARIMHACSFAKLGFDQSLCLFTKAVKRLKLSQTLGRILFYTVDERFSTLFVNVSSIVRSLS